MNLSNRKLLILDIAALGWDAVNHLPSSASRLEFHQAQAPFPAVTCVAQASFRTASLPTEHGMVSNGVYARDLRKPLFWEQSAHLVEGKRIWENFRAQGKQVGMLFWQQSLGDDVDLILSPRPIHKHNGGMIQACYSKPAGLYDQLTETIGKPFNLMHYWGPLANAKSSAWIVAATSAVMENPTLAPDLLFSYIPHLDYAMQRHGPDSPQALKAITELDTYLNQLLDVATKAGYEVMLFGDYAIKPISKKAVYPNRTLCDAGLFRVQLVKDMAYPDFFASEAFAMVDHEVAHVYLSKTCDRARVKSVLRDLDGVGEVLDASGQARMGINHERSGDFVLIAEEGGWFAYPWWTDTREAPDFATHIDIHNKPGYDPCELFFGWPPMSVSQNTDRIKGSHGAPGPDRAIAWASTCSLPGQPKSLVELAHAVQTLLRQDYDGKLSADLQRPVPVSR